MKKIKYISAVFLVCVGLVLIGETNAGHIVTAHRDRYTHTTFLFGEDFCEAIDTIKTTAERKNVIAFAVDTKFTSEMEQNLVVYSTRELPKEVTDTLGRGLPLKSLMLGSVHTTFESIDNAPSHTYGALFMHGNQNDIHAFITELSETYPRSMPIEVPTGDSAYRNMLIGYWAVALSYLLFLTLVETFFQKKEVFVRVTQGASVLSIVLRSIALDFAVYTAIFSGGSLVISRFTAVWHEPMLVLAIFEVFAVVNSLIYLLLFKLDFKSATSSTKMPTRVLKVSYLIKSAAALFAVAAITSSIMLITPTLKYFKAQEFFEAHREYDFAHFQHKINYNTGDVEDWYEQARRSTEMINEIYREYFDVAKPIILCSVYDPAEQYGSGGGERLYDFGIVYANINAFDYIASVIDGFTMDTVSGDMCVLIPSSVDNAEREKAIEAAIMYGGIYEGYTHSVYYYDNDTEVVAIRSGVRIDDGFMFHTNPVIVLDTTHPTDGRYRDISNYNGKIMYSFSDEILSEIITRYALDSEIAEVTNVLEIYNHSWHLIRAAIVTAVLISVLSLLLAFITIFRIVSLEYTVNAVEFCVKKILGWGAAKKNAGIVSGLFICNLLCAAIAIYVVMKLFSASFAVAAVAAGSIFLIDVLAVSWSVNRIEKARIVKILKGGAL